MRVILLPLVLLLTLAGGPACAAPDDVGVSAATTDASPPPSVVDEMVVADELPIAVETTAEAPRPAAATVPPELLTSPSGRRFYPTGAAHLDTALTYVGTVERGGNNRGPTVERFLRSVRLGPGAAWCAAFTSYVRRAASDADGRLRGPFESPGRPHYGAVATRHLGFGGVISAAEVWRGARSVPVGSLVVWRNGASWTGHVGVVWRDDDPTDEGFAPDDRSPDALAWRHRCGRTVEGNTSSGRSGSQRDGGGVYPRDRCLSHSYFRIVGFVPVTEA